MKHGDGFILGKPLISEKSMALQEVAGRYVFEVSVAARKPEIKQAIEQLYSVKVKAIRTLINPGKWKRLRSNYARSSNWKKAIVELRAGFKIDLFPTQG